MDYFGLTQKDKRALLRDLRLTWSAYSKTIDPVAKIGLFNVAQWQAGEMGRQLPDVLARLHRLRVQHVANEDEIKQLGFDTEGF